MPLEPGGVIGVSLTIQDYTNEKSDATVYWPDGLSLDGLAAEVANLEAIIAALTDGFIVGGTITQKLIQNTPFGAGPPNTSDVNRKGIFTFRNANGTSNKYEIPSLDRALLARGSNNLDPANAAVAAYVSMMISGGLGGLVGQPVSGAGLDLVQLLSARERDRNTDPNR